MTTIKLGYKGCDNNIDCPYFMEKWGSWCFGREDAPLAMLDTWRDYNTITLNAKSRNMVVKSKRHFFYQVFNYNYHLLEIHDINTSMPERQGKPMSAAYLTKPEPIAVPWRLCVNKHRYVHIGGFNADNRLKAYCALAIVGDVAIINTILGHCDSLSHGVMNGLIDYIVNYLKTTTGVKFLNYLDLTNCSPGLRAFKESVGFKSVSVKFEY